MSAKAVWTDEDVEQVTRMWTGGASASLIGRRLGKTRNAVLGKIGRLGLSRKNQPDVLRRSIGGNAPGLRPTSQGRSVLARAWTPKDDRFLTECWEEGYTTDEIAVRLGRDEAEVVRRGSRLGVLDPEPPEKFADAGWFARCNDRFCRAMQRALECGLVTLPGDVDER